MAKPDLGSKQKCQNCGTKFFDLMKDPVVCPKCGTVQSGAGPSPSPRAAAFRQPAAAVEEDETEAETPEVVSLDDADQIDDGKVAAVSPEDDIETDEAASDDDDTFLEEEEDDGGNVSDLIDGDIEDDEER